MPLEFHHHTHTYAIPISVGIPMGIPIPTAALQFCSSLAWSLGCIHTDTSMSLRVPVYSIAKMSLYARVVSGTRKFDHGLTQLIHVELHWLDIPERVKYKLSMITRRCLNGTAPQYLAAHCIPVSATESRQHLRSAASHQLVVPSYRLSSYGRRAFSVVGPTM